METVFFFILLRGANWIRNWTVRGREKSGYNEKKIANRWINSLNKKKGVTRRLWRNGFEILKCKRTTDILMRGPKTIIWIEAGDEPIEMKLIHGPSGGGGKKGPKREIALVGGRNDETPTSLGHASCILTTKSLFNHSTSKISEIISNSLTLF